MFWHQSQANQTSYCFIFINSFPLIVLFSKRSRRVSAFSLHTEAIAITFKQSHVLRCLHPCGKFLITADKQTWQMLYIFNSSTNTADQTHSVDDISSTRQWRCLDYSWFHSKWIFFFSPHLLFYIEACKCIFHYLSSYCKNVYFTLSFFSNACYYLGVHLNGDLTAYHCHMLEHILKCLLKEPVLNTSRSTGLLINHHSHKKLFPLTVQQTQEKEKGKKVKIHRFFEI